MNKLIGLGLMLFALCVTPVAADEDVYDGPTAIRPLTVTPQPQHSARPNTVCDFEHQCYPEKGGPRVQAPVAPPVVAAAPAAPRPKVPDEPIVATWRDCIGRALQSYEQSHNVHALQATTGSCQMLLEEQGGADYAGAEPSTPLAAPQANGRRNIGCGWWPIGSDADRDCATGRPTGRPTASFTAAFCSRRLNVRSGRPRRKDASMVYIGTNPLSGSGLRAPKQEPRGGPDSARSLSYDNERRPDG